MALDNLLIDPPAAGRIGDARGSFTRDEASARSGVAVGDIADWEDGRRAPSATVYTMYLLALGRHPGYELITRRRS